MDFRINRGNHSKHLSLYGLTDADLSVALSPRPALRSESRSGHSLLMLLTRNRCLLRNEVSISLHAGLELLDLTGT